MSGLSAKLSPSSLSFLCLGNIQKIPLRTLKEGIISNIKFIQKLIDNYPESIKKHKCSEKIKPKIKRKQFNVQSEASSGSFEWPKWRILEATLEKYNDLIKKFEDNQGNKEALKALENEGGSEEKEEEQKSKLLKSPEEIAKEKKKKDLKSRLTIYKKMLAAREKVSGLIKQHEQRWEQLIVSCFF